MWKLCIFKECLRPFYHFAKFIKLILTKWVLLYLNDLIGWLLQQIGQFYNQKCPQLKPKVSFAWLLNRFGALFGLSDEIYRVLKHSFLKYCLKQLVMTEGKANLMIEITFKVLLFEWISVIIRIHQFFFVSLHIYIWIILTVALWVLGGWISLYWLFIQCFTFRILEKIFFKLAVILLTLIHKLFKDFSLLFIFI